MSEISPKTRFSQTIRRRRRHIHRFLEWSAEREAKGKSLCAAQRQDVSDAKEAIQLFQKAYAWWGLVVFSSFGSLCGLTIVANEFAKPISSAEAQRVLDRAVFIPGSVGHHRIRPGYAGARQALIAACGRADIFRAILIDPALGFHDRYARLRDLNARQWGRTTCYDLLLRAGILQIAGSECLPDRAYLRGSRGPEGGFRDVWGVRVTRSNENLCEDLLRQWSKEWRTVAELVGFAWTGPPYTIGDLENALCIYHEYTSRERVHLPAC